MKELRKKKSKNNEFYESLAAEITADFERRRQERKHLEQQWTLNMNYLMGNQYAEIAPTGEIEERESEYL